MRHALRKSQVNPCCLRHSAGSAKSQWRLLETWLNARLYKENYKYLQYIKIGGMETYPQISFTVE